MQRLRLAASEKVNINKGKRPAQGVAGASQVGTLARG